MAFDDKTRRRLFKTVTTCRNLLTDDFDEQLRSRYGIYADEGSVRELDKLTNLDEFERNTAIALRERIEHLAAGGGRDAISTAVHRIRREQAFTILNRLAAVRMAEERQIISQSVGAGLQSKGFRVFEQAAGAALGSQIERYLTYLDCLFDELSLDLGILFDRSDALGLLFPTEKGLREIFDELNDPEIAPLWAEDETIGWIYQYWNTRQEITEMRRHGAPRNSRELAVRNQFFTPRYVVEFLTDNTLGRIWYEMTRGQTRLAEQCRYLVRRPTEIFLAEGETTPETTEQEEGLSQKELLKQPVKIPHRPLKDPREIRLLDPACGSMHFGLYAFDLFEVIYEESWDNGSSPALQKAYESKGDFLKDVPRLIIEHNIHGVDIDPRATQIAALSLWLRAQKAWRAQAVKPIDRPRVRRSNIVCAEPMPGSPEMLEDFVATLDPPLLGELVKTVFEKMQLAGEAGTLLKIEEEIRGSINTARKAWERFETKPCEIFSTEELSETTSSPEFTGLEKALTIGLRPLNTDFFDTAEQQVVDALRAYAEQADADSYQRRLFADDAARGFAFIHLCRQRYDAVVMNPPFGEPSTNTIEYLRNSYSMLNDNLYCGFFSRMLALLSSGGSCGAITDRSFLTKQAYESLRSFFVDGVGPQVVADLGWEVLDANVETCVSISGKLTSRSLFTNIGDAGDTKSDELLRRSQDAESWISERLSTFATLPFCSFAYSMPEWMRLGYRNVQNRFEFSVARVARGMAGANAERLYRVIFEVPVGQIGWENRWVALQKGSPYSPFYFGPQQLLLSEARSFKTVLSYGAGRVTGHEDYGEVGLAFGKRTDFMYAYVMQPRQVFSVEGQGVFPHKKLGFWQALAIINSSAFQCLVNEICGQHKYHGYVNAVHLNAQRIPDCSKQSKMIWEQLSRFDSRNETACHFVFPRSIADGEAGESLSDIVRSVLENTMLILDKCSLLHNEINIAAAEALGAHSSLAGGSSKVDYVRVLFGESDSPQLEASSLTSYLVGTAFGRWDIRYATSERQPPKLPAPFDPLPVCPPGMLQNAKGLPAKSKDLPSDYPLPISWPGILVDDENHPEDIVARVREAIEVIWKARADAIEQEACEILGVKAKPRENLDALRIYFRDPNRFFKDHLARYSKSRRKAPIYWPLSTESGSYTLWIYYHRLDSQTLYTCVRKFIDPKREDLGQDIEAFRNQIGTEGTTDERQKLEEMITFQQELKVFRDRLIKVADMPYRPNLNDGVQITVAPLWECFRHRQWQAALKKTWAELSKKEQYDWSHLAMSMWPERVTLKCATDRSLAIAHGIEDLLWVPDSQARRDDQYRPLQRPEEELKLLEAEQSKEDIEKATKDYEAAKALGLDRHLWVEHPEGNWRRRLTPKQEIESEINCRKGR